MFRKNKKGFTLIELATVLIIISVILVITVPIIVDLVDNARKKAFAQSAQNILEAAELYYRKLQLEDSDNIEEVHMNFPNDVKFTFKGEMPTYGTLTILPNGSISFSIENEDYCAIKKFESKEIDLKDAPCNGGGLREESDR